MSKMQNSKVLKKLHKRSEVPKVIQRVQNGPRPSEIRERRSEIRQNDENGENDPKLCEIMTNNQTRSKGTG